MRKGYTYKVLSIMGDGDANLTKKIISEVGMDLYDIFVEVEVEFFDGIVGRLPDNGEKSPVRDVLQDFCICGADHSCNASLTVRLAAVSGREMGVFVIVTNG
jgi:hypothetical protein